MNNISSDYTVVEVSGKDRPSILHELAKAIHFLDLNLFRAQVATFGERVVDVLYLRFPRPPFPPLHIKSSS